MHRAVKVRLYPNRYQAHLIDKHFDQTRWVYNWALEQKIKCYQETGKSLIKTSNLLTELKQQKEYEWLYETSAGAHQMALRNLDEAFTGFFKLHKGFPKFKSKKHSKQTYSLNNQKFLLDEDTSKIRVEKLGWLKMRGFRPGLGKQISVTVSKATDKYYASILFDDGQELPEKPEIQPEQTIGIDLGLKHFLTVSDGLKVENPRHIKKQEARIKRLQRRMDKKQKASKNREKARVRLAKEHVRLVNRRTDFLHKLSTKLIRENQTICIETLDVQELLSKGFRSLHRAISDASWSAFCSMLSYKADWNGKHVIKIGRFEPSSKMCSSCGKIKQDMTLADRSWQCACGAQHDRDVNAAVNIKQMALQRQNLIGQVPLSQREVKPVESCCKTTRRSRNQLEG